MKAIVIAAGRALKDAPISDGIPKCLLKVGKKRGNKEGEAMKIVYSYYVLDIVHTGHLVMMKNAKAIAGEDGKSIVGILTDEAVMEKKKKPVLSFPERMELAAAIKYVDVVVAQNTYSPLPNVMKIRPDVLMESTSHEEAEIEKARKYMKSIGGKVIALPYYPAQSSTSIKKAIKRKS